MINRANRCYIHGNVLHALIAFTTGLFLLALAFPVMAADSGKNKVKKEKEENFKYEDKNLRFGIYLRTPEQMAAFYEGRGFPKNAIKEISKTCFMTIVIRNYSKNKIWLDLKDWKFYSGQGPVHRIDRYQWKNTWDQLNVPLANQSTFTWTLLPEARDLHPDEPVGGNLIFVPIDYPFTIEANFKTGENKDGKPYQVKMENVICEKNRKTNE